MSVIRATLTLDPGAIPALETALDQEVKAELVKVADAVGHTAAQTHPWQNRTGRLESETRGDNIVWNDLYGSPRLYVEVLGNTEYGSFLEHNPRWAWLEPAWRVNEPYAAQDLDAALQRAATAAGW